MYIHHNTHIYMYIHHNIHIYMYIHHNTQDHYSSLAQAMIGHQCSDPEVQSRLIEAFNQLTPPSLKLDLSRNSKTQFRKNLEHFLPHVKGFLYYR